ncbi:hypothetical protein QR680_015520 [Steinernema hermaphroditum]|uniref:W02B3.4-like N-terminal domain-containing protein n=1 Tax=Steinernema hermaphroditum TaxID=289476 RepID=A0AA39LKV3_9BILA|nr:hypothetical protein QR680_015520 [Steinernema hermaphroditum]
MLCIFVAYSATTIPYSDQKLFRSIKLDHSKRATTKNIVSTTSEPNPSTSVELPTESTPPPTTTEPADVFNNSRLILIDKEALTCLPCNLPNRPLEFITLEGHIPKSNNIHSSDPSIIYKVHDDSSKDYYMIDVKGEKRAIRKFKTVETSHGYSAPENVELFLWEWKRSRFIECRNINMNRTEEDSRRHISLGAIDEVAELRDVAIAHRVTLLLDSGTKLGWYRECSLIPHTNDLDLAIMHDEHSSQLLHELDISKKYHLYITYGEPSECFVFKLMQTAKLDISYMYHNDSLSWTCSSSGSERMRFAITKTTQDNVCVGDLHGKLMFVPCEVLKHIEMGYGEEWMKDHPSTEYSWQSSGHNIFGREENNDTWTVREQSEDYDLG